jgi:outer membrane protein, heavy metal efflux system
VYRRWLIAALVLLGSGPARALPELPRATALPATLRLGEALNLLRSHGLDLLIIEAAVSGAEGDVRIAGAIQNPALTVSLGGSFQCTGVGGKSAADCMFASVGLSDSAALENTISGKRALRVEVARAALAAARLGRDDARRTLELQVKQQFIQVLLAQEGLRFARDVSASMADSLRKNQRRYQLGAINEADLAKTETAKLETDQAVDNAGQALRAAKVGLAFLLGVRGPLPEFSVEQPELLHHQVPARLAAPSRTELLELAFASRPDLRAAGYQRSRAEASVRLTRRLRFPDIALAVSYSQEGSGASAITPPTIAIGLSAPIPLLYQQQGEIRRAEVDYRTQVLLQAKVAAQVSAEVETAFSAYTTTTSLVQRMESRLLKSAQKARDLAKFQYDKGATSLLEFLDAQRTYSAINAEYRQDLAAYWTAVFQLEQAVGTELR